MRGPSSLSPAEREMIATYVSNGNECYFCTQSHAATARYLYGGEAGVVDSVLADLDTAPVSDKMKALLVIADKVRRDARTVTEGDVAQARAHGADDQAIHDTVLTAAAFCMFNRSGEARRRSPSDGGARSPWGMSTVTPQEEFPVTGYVSTQDVSTHHEGSGAHRAVRSTYRLCALIGLGGLFAGVTGPLLSNFIPPLVRDALGEHRTAIGAVMAIDNVLLLVLLPWAGPASDRASARGRGRMPLVVAGFVLSALGMAVLPSSAALGLPVMIGALVLLHSGINVQRAPFQALVADLVPSRYRSLATGSITFQMCVGAIVFLMLGRMLGMQTAFLIASGTVLGIAAVMALSLREQAPADARSADVTFRSLAEAAWSALRGDMPAMRAIFLAAFFLQLTFQTFTTWYALHGTERFGVRPEDVTIGFIAWAVGGVLGALPAGFIGVRIGRRNAMLVGFALLAVCLLALDRVTNIAHVVPLLALASASWTLPTVNAYPLFVEPIPRERRGVLAALFLLCIALGGAIGDPLNGRLFDLLDGYRPLFLLMTCYTALAFVTVLFIPRGTGEADTGPDAALGLL